MTTSARWNETQVFERFASDALLAGSDRVHLGLGDEGGDFPEQSFGGSHDHACEAGLAQAGRTAKRQDRFERIEKAQEFGLGAPQWQGKGLKSIGELVVALN